MLSTDAFIEKLRILGVGRRSFDDELFGAIRAPARLGVYDEDVEEFCHEITSSVCTVPGCAFAASPRQLEQHYAARHRYGCAVCRRALPSPHLLDLHVQETHDSFFAAMAARQPSYCCYIQECASKFLNAEERMKHCVEVHKLPKNFRFEIKPKETRKTNHKSVSESTEAPTPMDAGEAGRDSQTFSFHNSKQKSIAKYSGKKFTSNETRKSWNEPDMNKIMLDLKENLPG